jgi:hypothetical protein
LYQNPRITVVRSIGLFEKAPFKGFDICCRIYSAIEYNQRRLEVYSDRPPNHDGKLWELIPWGKIRISKITFSFPDAVIVRTRGKARFVAENKRKFPEFAKKVPFEIYSKLDAGTDILIT